MYIDRIISTLRKDLLLYLSSYFTKIAITFIILFAENVCLIFIQVIQYCFCDSINAFFLSLCKMEIRKKYNCHLHLSNLLKFLVLDPYQKFSQIYIYIFLILLFRRERTSTHLKIT